MNDPIPILDPSSEEWQMHDVVVTVPKSFGLQKWIEEGDAAGDPYSGEEWHFYLSKTQHPKLLKPGDHVYIVFNGKLRGYAPLVRIEQYPTKIALVRGGGAVAVTIDEYIPGFRGFRYRWWFYEHERPFPDWKIP